MCSTCGMRVCMCVRVCLPVMRVDGVVVRLARLADARVVPASDVLACGVWMLAAGGWCVGCMRCGGVRRVALGGCQCRGSVIESVMGGVCCVVCVPSHLTFVFFLKWCECGC